VARALQCPACGHLHRIRPTGALPEAATFRCRGCGRTLRVPVAAPGPGRESVARTGAPRHARGGVPHGVARGPVGPGPRSLRPRQVLAVWLVAVPLGGLVVGWVAQATGFLTGSRLIDIMTGVGWFRYWRLGLLVPLWGVTTAAIVTLLLALARRESRPGRTRRGVLPAPVPAPGRASGRVRPGHGSVQPADIPARTGPAERPRRRIPRRDEIEDGSGNPTGRMIRP